MNTYLPHLIEIRKRLIRCIWIIGLILAVFFYFDNVLYNLIAKPLLNALPQGSMLIATEVTSTFMVPMKLAYLSALFVSMPYILYEIWSFISPGLYLSERKKIIPVIIMSSIFFYLGSLFGYFVICPMALNFFASCAPENVEVMTDIHYYLDFVLTVVFSSGIAFQMPILTFILAKTGLVSVEQLAHLRPYVIVLAFILGMLLTPPDVVSQILLALPIWCLFELTLWFLKMKRPYFGI